MKLRPGTYFVGDPCYCFEDHKEWCNLLDHCDYFSGADVFLYKDMTVFGAGTMYGDGGYYDQEGNEYSVDAGLIGAIPVELIGKKYEDEFMKRLGQFVTFLEPVDCYEEDGDIVIGHIRIATGDTCTEDEY